MQLMKTLAAAVTAVLVSTGVSAAPILSISPADVNVPEGELRAVALVISGLGEYAPPSLGAFYVEISFDEAILDYVSVVYGNLLGDPADADQTTIVTTPGFGSVTLDETSTVWSTEFLDALQPAAFTLATITFRGQALGTSTLSLTPLDFADALGNTLNPDVTGGSILVPVPATAALLLPFGLLLARRARCV